MGISMILGGSEPLPGWFGAVMQWKLKLKWAFACVKEGVKACQDALCTMYRQNGDLANLLKSARKKVPQSARLSAGGGGNRYLGNAQIEVTLIWKVLP